MLIQIIESEIKHFPMYFLQASAIIGIFAILLIFRGKSAIFDQKSNTIGIVLGLTGFFLSAFIFDLIQTESKPYIRNDLIFLAGFLGGYRNASWAALLTFGGRILFGGGSNIFIAGVDIFFIAYGAAFIRNLFFKDQSIENILFKKAIGILLLRYVITVLPVIIFFVAGFLNVDSAMSIIVKRTLSSFSVSIFIIYMLIVVIKQAIYKDNSYFIDEITGLSNRRALQRKVERRHLSFGPNENKITNTIFLVVVRNIYELVNEYDHNWTDNYYLKLSKQLSSFSSNKLLSNYTPKVYAFSDRSILIVLHNVGTQEVIKKELAQKLFYQIHNYSENSKLAPILTVGVIEMTLDSNVLSASQFLRNVALMETYEHELIHYFEPTIAKQIEHDKDTRKKIEQWIQAGIAPLWLQPKIDLTNDKCIGAEVLLRALKEDDINNYEIPSYILKIAERFRLLEKLEVTIVQTALNYMQQMPDLKISVNISSVPLLSPGFGREICSSLREKNVNPKNLTIEIIETYKLVITDEVLNNFKEISSVGVNFSLDDFGAGYASLSLMAKLPFSELKLDYSMISNINQPRTLTAIISAIDTAKRYKVHVVAEGIETKKQKEQLLKIGVTYGQGFLFAKAMPIEQFTKFMEKNNNIG